VPTLVSGLLGNLCVTCYTSTQVSSRDTRGFIVNKLKGNAMIKIVNKELVNKVNELKALSLGLTSCDKLLQLCNYSTMRNETSYYTSELLTVLTTKST